MESTIPWVSGTDREFVRADLTMSIAPLGGGPGVTGTDGHSFD